ncbi:MAG: glycoside hydrolase family 2 protein [Reyranella sp.]|uniref:glycoside hydrolase family 2 protein n=1 Tax=Reyranella sp. TaxID=1929291 RepID=UPI00121E1F6E|nr:glycoside hydrolase family 2 protein [Reyranella sp.]TAJ86848.1 MAG: glycoside hydrolase family 2 protein [Reyranella sp.]
MEWHLACTAPGSVQTPADLPALLDWIAAPVPGTAAQALREAGRWTLEDPLPLHDQDIWYRTRVDGNGRRLLRFNGLATLAEVWLNGRSILVGDNMFLIHEVEVDLAGDNELAIVFRSLDVELARRKGRARWRTALVENNALRQVRTTLLGHMTGWQPAVHAVGPWRAVELIGQMGAPHVRAKRIRATLDGDDGLLDVSLDIDSSGTRPEARLTVAGIDAPLEWTGEGQLRGRMRVPDVEKWWPHTHGTPTLHRVRLVVGDFEIDLGQVGFRSIDIDGGVDGRGFALRVNGQPIFARGACWSTADLVTLASDREALAPWLRQARDAHMNMIRVGGTMVYESDDFFALCDELGLLVWHDFMFANMDYPIADPSFRASVEREADQFLGRVQAHPSLAVLCGGSEVGQQTAMLGLPPSLWSSPLFDEILPGIAAARCPDVVFVAQSPSGGVLPFQVDTRVSHYYGVGAYRRPLEDARRADVRFAAECLAFANTPAASTPARASDIVPRDRGAEWDFTRVRDHYLAQLYGVDAAKLQTEDPVHYLRLSRALSADLMEAVVAEWRRPASRCAGALVWMLKDLSPGPGWGVVDSSGIPKLAWHGLRRAFRPVQVALTDEGLNGLAVHLINETAAPVSAKLSLLCLQAGDVVVMKRECELTMPARSARTMSAAELIGSFFDITYAYRFGPPPLELAAVALDDAGTGARLGEAAYFPLGRSAITHDPGLSAKLERDGEGWSVVVQADRFAPCIQIEAPHHHAGDEGFHLLPGEQRRVKLLPAAGAGEKPPTGEVLSVAPKRATSCRFG